ncbi:DNA mismatch repair protein MutS [Thermosinus carboxydivorans Nor1]|uniref:DNA mismatch repair protein MutS n=1 Tax=Thermosinus carboxydivorans Nor1 TaxID=401526 RepID=A1HMV0_9FIRM|nr:DNA mismatch repair protein MutS [Thermosinus carboxydivorans]EAX48583.1 DNA mismatch repair protein MutS [Thermosinus carboxydivorans Nor1]
MAETYTPMIEQYREIKRQHADKILFFRLGDFYEMFFEDAEIAARELEITLTGRDGGAGRRVPMCGVPFHAADTYIARLINKGYKVAICEQVEDPKQAKGIVRREVIKIITPGTVLSDVLLPDKSNNYLVVIHEQNDIITMAGADISTGECYWADFAGPYRLNTLCDHLYRLSPAEIVLTGLLTDKETLDTFLANRLHGCTITNLAIENSETTQELLQHHFPDEELPHSGAAIAVGHLLYYLHQTLKTDLSHVNRLMRYNAAEFMTIDTAALRNLEITRNLRDGGRKDTLLSILDFTQTAMGGRLLKKWLEYPLLSVHEIIRRQDAVDELLTNPGVRQVLQEKLGHIYDLERIVTRAEVGTANGRDLIALKQSLSSLPTIKLHVQSMQSALLGEIGAKMETYEDIVALIDRAIVDNPPHSVRDGGIIKTGYNQELDELREIAQDSQQWLMAFEAREKERTGIKSLKVGYNKVFGYYIEVTNANRAAVPSEYIRKQTLTSAERYITPELKEFETKVLGAQEKIVQLEYYLFTIVRDCVKKHIPRLQETARQLAVIDCLVSLSEAAARYNYRRPAITNNREIIIRDGRHPVVERLLDREVFVPNDTELNHHDCEVMIITGPNMAGKSTYMRQVALLVLMAQVGSFIPAREAAITPVDRIFTRVGASDDLATGQSTFMVEMNEVAHILKHATTNSLVILDEIGRGTSTFDGMSIARAVIEYIKDRIKAKTLFATHYHELTELAEQKKGIKNFTVAVKERGSEVVFLRRIVPGGADKSYGIHVARLAGLPKKVIERAQTILAELEQYAVAHVLAATALPAPQAHVSLFSDPIIEELLKVDIMTTTPLEALNILFKLQKMAKEGSGR